MKEGTEYYNGLSGMLHYWKKVLRHRLNRALGTGFFQPVPRNRDQRPLALTSGKITGTNGTNFCQKYACGAGIRTWDLLHHVYLSYHLTYTSLVMGREIFSF